jgi:TRAP-type C4-dicarboxylate transport system substrate-binding protein
MPCAGLATTGKEIYKWEDAEGLKAVGAGPAPESRQAAVGIVPVSVEPPDVYMSFKTGTLDAIASALISLKDFGWADVLPIVSMVNLNGGPRAYVMNKDTRESLPSDIQQVFTDMATWLPAAFK